jgi:hypothetical protein
MQARHVVLAILAFAVLGFATLALLRTAGRLPPTLTRAYETVSSMASSVSGGFPSSPAASGDPDSDAAPAMGDAGALPPRVGDAGTVGAHRIAQAAPLSSAQLGAPLVNGKFVSECGAPDDMKVVVKVTVRMGHPTAVTVATDPPNGAVASCVEKSTREMHWDVSPNTRR